MHKTLKIFQALHLRRRDSTNYCILTLLPPQRKQSPVLESFARSFASKFLIYLHFIQSNHPWKYDAQLTYECGQEKGYSFCKHPLLFQKSKYVLQILQHIIKYCKYIFFKYQLLFLRSINCIGLLTVIEFIRMSKICSISSDIQARV